MRHMVVASEAEVRAGAGTLLVPLVAKGVCADLAHNWRIPARLDIRSGGPGRNHDFCGHAAPGQGRRHMLLARSTGLIEHLGVPGVDLPNSASNDASKCW